MHISGNAISSALFCTSKKGRVEKKRLVLGFIPEKLLIITIADTKARPRSKDFGQSEPKYSLPLLTIIKQKTRITTAQTPSAPPVSPEKIFPFDRTRLTVKEYAKLSRAGRTTSEKEEALTLSKKAFIGMIV